MHNCIRALLQLDRLSSQFPDQLSDILARREFDQCIERLEDDDLVQVIEYLDKVLPSFHQFRSLSAEPVAGP